MYPILHHPILDIPEREITTFEYKGQQVKAAKGYTIAAALHQAGFPIHSHSLKGRERSMDCGIGKCGACEMLVDGVVKRICVTLVDGVKKVEEIAHNYLPENEAAVKNAAPKVYKTEVVIVGTMTEVITKVLYPADDHIEGKTLRLKQQYFFVSASAQDIVRKHIRKWGDIRSFSKQFEPVLLPPELQNLKSQPFQK